MQRARGVSAGYWTIAVSALWLGAVACGGSGDDDAAGNPADAGEDGYGGTSTTSGGSGNDPDAGEPGDGSGGTSASAGRSSDAGTGSSNAGTGASAGSTGSAGTLGGGDSEELLEEIEDACETDCDAQFATECAPQNTNTLTCQLSCAASTVQVGDFCLEEYRDYIECRGDGGYECVNDYPYQRSTCVAEQVAFTECTQHIGCKRYCKKAIDEGCSDDSFEDCVESCIALDDDLPEDCRYYQENIAYCQATNPTECSDGGLSTPAACSYQVLNIAECVSDDAGDLCAGWCWAADKLDCGGDDCAEECAEKSADETCGAAWQRLLDCGLFFGDAACDTELLNANGICDSEVEQYEACLEGMPDP